MALLEVFVPVAVEVRAPLQALTAPLRTGPMRIH